MLGVLILLTVRRVPIPGSGDAGPAPSQQTHLSSFHRRGFGWVSPTASPCALLSAFPCALGVTLSCQHLLVLMGPKRSEMRILQVRGTG